MTRTIVFLMTLVFALPHGAEAQRLTQSEACSPTGNTRNPGICGAPGPGVLSGRDRAYCTVKPYVARSAPFV